MRCCWVAVAILCCAAAPAAAQAPIPVRKHFPVNPPAGQGPGGGRVGPDTGQARRDSLADTTRAGGLPTGPSRTFQAADSVETELLQLPGFAVTRYSADSVQFRPPEKQIRMSGEALVQKGGSTLQADTIRYAEEHCVLTAAGSPQLFDVTGVMVGEGMVYDACNHAGIIAHAQTAQKQGSATWILHGDLAVDNAEGRVYGAAANITSCDLPDPHYHFAAHEVKWVSKTLMVARPAVLYVADVPVMWLPFIFQDMRRDRHSGLIPPSFGLSDIVRNSPTYHRHVSNLGYYWAISDYTDAQVNMDWYSHNFISVRGVVRYRWLDRFMSGYLNLQEMHQFGAGTSYQVVWTHQQDFSLDSHLNANVNYVTSSSIVSRNTVDPVLALATIYSAVNYTQRFPWGALQVGGSRTQNLNNPQVTTNFPSVSFTPNPIAISQSVTWSPGFSVSNTLQSQQPTSTYTYAGDPLDSTNVLLDTRQTAVSLTTPLQLGRWMWNNSLSLTDQYNNQRATLTLPDPADTTRRITRTYDQFFETDVDWSTGIGLPMIFQGTWNLQPSISVVNTGGGPFMLRNRYTGGAFVTQGKRLSYSVAVSPTFYALLPGFGPIARIRHTFSPSVSWSYAPAATINAAYARAIAGDNPVINDRSPATQTLTFGLNQNFEAKLRAPARPARGDSARADSARADTAGAPPPPARKIKLLSIQTSAVAIDLEQAKRPGYTGWVTGTLSNTFSTDLLPGFSLSTSHSLFNGTPDTVTSRFHPFLTSLSARFGIGPSAFSWLGSLLGLTRPPAAPSTPGQAQRDSARAASDTAPAFTRLAPDPYQRGIFANQAAVGQIGLRPGGTGFSASLAFDLSRVRPNAVATATPGVAGTVVTTPTETHSTLNGSLSFAPTPHWSVSWSTLYDFQAGKFGSHVLTLNRDLHDWKAVFAFVQSPNGNVVFNFTIALIPQPEIKVDYDQQSLPLQ